MIKDAILSDYNSFAAQKYEEAIDRSARKNDYVSYYLYGPERIRERYRQWTPYPLWEAKHSWELKKVYAEERLEIVFAISSIVATIATIVKR